MYFTGRIVANGPLCPARNNLRIAADGIWGLCTICGAPSMAPPTIAYRARYGTKNLKRDPYGDPAECTVTL